MSGAALEASDVADLLASLTERSLVTCDAATGRCSLLWMVREHACEALAAEGEGEAVRRRPSRRAGIPHGAGPAPGG